MNDRLKVNGIDEKRRVAQATRRGAMCVAQGLSRATQAESLDGQDCYTSVAVAGPEHRSGYRGIAA
jgi:hypothetical protein